MEPVDKPGHTENESDFSADKIKKAPSHNGMKASPTVPPELRKRAAQAICNGISRRAHRARSGGGRRQKPDGTAFSKRRASL
jgi:hypothetical protein